MASRVASRVASRAATRVAMSNDAPRRSRVPPANEKIECNKSPDCHAVPLCGWLTAPAADAYLDIRVHEGTHRSVHRRRHRAPPQSAAIGVGPAAQASVLDPGARPRRLRAAEWTPVNIRKCGYCQERAPSNTSRCWPRRPPPSDAAMSVNEFARRKLGGGLPSSFKHVHLCVELLGSMLLHRVSPQMPTNRYF